MKNAYQSDFLFPFVKFKFLIKIILNEKMCQYFQIKATTFQVTFPFQNNKF